MVARESEEDDGSAGNTIYSIPEAEQERGEEVPSTSTTERPYQPPTLTPRQKVTSYFNTAFSALTSLETYQAVEIISPPQLIFYSLFLPQDVPLGTGIGVSIVAFLSLVAAAILVMMIQKRRRLREQQQQQQTSSRNQEEDAEGRGARNRHSSLWTCHFPSAGSLMARRSRDRVPFSLSNEIFRYLEYEAVLNSKSCLVYKSTQFFPQFL